MVPEENSGLRWLTADETKPLCSEGISRIVDRLGPSHAKGPGGGFLLARREWCRRRTPDDTNICHETNRRASIHHGGTMKIRKRGTSFPARLSCGHLSLVSHAAIYAGTSLCKACPQKVSIRHIDKVLTLRASSAVRPWGTCY